MADVISFPFLQGQHEETDARILPTGLLASVQNMRLRKDGRLVSRWGYRYDANVLPPDTAYERVIEVGSSAALLVSGTSFSVKTPGLVLSQASPTENLYSLPLFYGVTRTPAARNLSGAVGTVSLCAINANSASALVIAAWDDFGGAGGITQTHFRVYSRDGTPIREQWVSSLFLQRPTLASYGASAYCLARLYNYPNNYIYKFDSGTLQFSQDSAVASTANASDASGDAVCLSADVVLYTVYTSGTWKIRKYTSSTKTDAAFATVTAGAGSPSAYTSLTILNDGNVLCISNVAGTVSYEIFLPTGGAGVTGGTVGGGIALPASGAANAIPYGSDGWLCVLTGISSGAFIVEAWSDAGTKMFSANNATAVGKPFTISLSGVTSYYCWLSDNIVTSPLLGEPRQSLRLCDITQSYLSTHGIRADASAMQLEHVGYQDDVRTPVVVLPAVGTLPSRLVVHGIGKTLINGGWTKSYSDLAWVDYGPMADGVNEVSANGSTYVAAARLQEWDGTQMFPSGLEFGPCRIVAMNTGVGSGPDAGAHQYVACWRHIDARGNILRSPPCAPITVTSTGHPFTVALPGPALDMFASYSRPPVLELYRTVVNGTFYYLCATSVGSTLSDSMSDADLIKQPILYTQGDRNGVSGLLPNDEPPPCRYIAAGDSRLMVGGLENPYEVQWSKLFFPGEQVSWSSDAAYRRSVPEPVTAVAALDGAWAIFTAKAIYMVSGIGPSDNGADGDFGEPRRLPSDVGCLSQRSIVACSLGVLFQGTNGSFWLLPRGGNAPQWIGQLMRDTMATYPIVRDSALVENENCIYWAVTDGSTGKALVVYDLRNGQWYLDPFVSGMPALHSLSIFGGALLINGVIPQTPALYVDDYSGSAAVAITQVFVTGDIRPFGEAGWGRCRMFGLLGEVRNRSCTVNAFVSYDGGSSPSWTDAYSWNTSAVSTSVGDELDLQFGPSQVRNCNYRVMVSIVPGGTGNEGVQFNALAMELYKAERLRRLPAAKRG